jgi:chitosanase
VAQTSAPLAQKKTQHDRRKAPSTAINLKDPAKKEIAMQLVSCDENSSLDWKAQYAYIEYNVEGNEKENRGYTAGIIGFTSKTHDMLELVEYYEKVAPGNSLSAFLPALRKADGTASKSGLGRNFEDAWKSAGKDRKFREAQDRERRWAQPARPVRLLRCDRDARSGRGADKLRRHPIFRAEKGRGSR